MPTPESVQLKLHRAIVHRETLIFELNGYYALNPSRIVRHPDSKPGHAIGIMETHIPVPKRISLIAGDFLQNIRSTLDYLVWELMLTTPNVPDKHSFPICTTEEGWKIVKRGDRLTGMPANPMRIIESMQPWTASSPKLHPLFILDELTNINKHRRILIASVVGAPASNFNAVDVDGERYVFGSAIGSENMKIRVSGTPTETTLDPVPTVFVALAEGPAKGIEITQALMVLYDFITDKILPQFEQFFR
jgi:hypothetical protein